MRREFKKFIILDRDGVIVVDKKYVHKIEDLEFMPNAIEALKKIQDFGYKLIVATNQAGIARGLYTEEDAIKFNLELIKRLKTENVNIEKIYICPHHPEFTGDCDCRKPKIGLAKKAASEFGFDLKGSKFIGDKDTDTEFGKNCGGMTFLVDNGQYEIKILPDFRAKSLLEISNLILNLKQ